MRSAASARSHRCTDVCSLVYLKKNTLPVTSTLFSFRASRYYAEVEMNKAYSKMSVGKSSGDTPPVSRSKNSNIAHLADGAVLSLSFSDGPAV